MTNLIEREIPVVYGDPKAMGRLVAVYKVYERSSTFNTYYESKDYYELGIERRVGWIVGFSIIRSGDIERSEDGSTFKASADHRAVNVVFWPTEKLVHCPPGGVKELKLHHGGTLVENGSWFGLKAMGEELPHRSGEMNADDRKRLAEDMKREMQGWPRDGRGRWKTKDSPL
jgi:hypothetical protein